MHLPVLVDSNVILDVATRDPRWYRSSSLALRTAADEALLVINPLIYAEISVGYSKVEDVDTEIPSDLFRRDPLPYAAGFLAGKAFQQYRKRGGMRSSPLPDFYIGAHAAIAGFRLLTRDAARYRTYFPRLKLIVPTDPRA